MQTPEGEAAPGSNGKVQASLSAKAARQLALRTLVDDALSRRPGAVVGCGDVSRLGMNLLANRALSWAVRAFFSAGSDTHEQSVRFLVNEHRAHGYRCTALDLGASSADLPAKPYPASIAVLHLVGDREQDLLRCLSALYPYVARGGAVVLEGPAVRAALDRLATSLGLVATAAGHEDLACWVHPGVNSDPPDAAHGRAGRRDGFTVLTYPDPASGKFRLLCDAAGYHLTTDPTEPFDLAIKWHGETWTLNDAVLEDVAAVTTVLNLGCDDISKRRVEQVHLAVFGYGLLVDPRRFHGRCVKKANLNAQCRESVVECPRRDADEDEFVYQRLIVTPREPDEFEEYRVPITGGEIPCVVIKRRSLAARFNRSTGHAVIATADEVFTPAERDMVLALCRAFSLDFGDLDVIRDRMDGRLHVIDVNPTPGGPGGPGYGYTEEQRRTLLAVQGDALRRVFVDGRGGVAPTSRLRGKDGGQVVTQ